MGAYDADVSFALQLGATSANLCFYALICDGSVDVCHHEDLITVKEVLFDFPPPRNISIPKT